MKRTHRTVHPLAHALLPVAYLWAGPAVAQATAQEAAPPTTPVDAATPTTSTRLDADERKLQALSSRLDAAEQALAARTRAQGIVTAEEAGFGIGSPDKLFQVRLHGQLQIDGRRFFDDDSLRDLDTFLVRRARPTVEVTLLGLADAVFTPDFAGGALQLFDAYIDVHPRPWLRLRAGKFKPPIGLERLQADNNLVFLERALDQNLSAQRDVGVQLWGDVGGGLVRYEAAIFNGVPDSALNDTDSSYSKSLAGRLFVQPFALQGLSWLGRLGVGFAAETGSEKGSSTVSNGAVTGTWLGSFKSIGQATIFSYLSSATDPSQTVTALHRHTRLNPQLYYYLGPLGLESEYLREKQSLDKNGAGASVTNSAGHVTVAYVIGGKRTFEGPRLNSPIDLAAGTLGALELGARYSWLTIDSGAFDDKLADRTKSVAKAKAWGVVASWYLTRSLRAAASYDQTTFDGGAKNGSALADRHTERVLIGRLQVGY